MDFKTDSKRWIVKITAYATEQQQRIEALEATLKTANGMAQLAVQQIAALKRQTDEIIAASHNMQMVDMRAVSQPSGNDNKL
jgi:hypothetical protein